MSNARKLVVAVALLVASAAMTACSDIAAPSEQSVPAFDTQCTESQGSVC